MALQKFLVDFDLNGNKLSNVVLGTEAGTAAGAVWFDASTHEIKYISQSGTTQVAATASSVSAVADDLAVVASDLADEISRALAAEGSLDSRLDTVESTLAALDATYATDAALATEAATRQNVDNQIIAQVTAGFTQGGNRMTAIEAVNTTQNGRLDAVEASIAGLDSTYATDAALAGSVSALEAADASISAEIVSEAAARTSAVSAVASDLSDEVSRATAAEAGLASDISDEASARAAADSALDVRVSSVEGTLAALDATYATEAEVSAAIAIETSAREAAVSGVASDLSDEVSAREAAVSGVASDLASEVSARESAVSAVAGDLASEVSRAEAAESDLDGRLDTIESNYTRKYATAVGNGSSTSFTVTHNLNSEDVVVSVREAASGAVVVASITHTSANVVTVEVNSAPVSNGLKVVVIG